MRADSSKSLEQHRNARQQQKSIDHFVELRRAQLAEGP
jgi:hypothetical protein